MAPAPHEDGPALAPEDAPHGVAPAPPSEIVRRALAITVWIALFLGLVPLGNRVVPDETKAHVSLQTFLLACQILTLVVGVGFALLVLRRRREGLGFDRRPTAAGVLSTLFAVPLVFVASSYVALQIAMPTLLEELRTRGANASQQNAGQFGKLLTQAPVLTTLVWGAVLGALGEELFFRGLLWSTLTDLTKRLLPPKTHDGAPASMRDGAPAGMRDGAPASMREGAPASARTAAAAPRTMGRRVLEIALEGGLATLACAALFGWMHKDLPGGVGIVRVVSTTCLGLASGVVRQATRGVVACIALHALYNTLVIGAGRKWFTTREDPVLEGIPNPMLVLAVIGLAAIGAVAFVRALAARRARSAFVPD
jgi:membrane protease YdiL (CAAX protease family)